MKKIHIFFSVLVFSLLNLWVLADMKNNYAYAAEDLIKKGDALTLQRCVDIALKRKPSIIAAQSAVTANESRIGQAESNYYPQVTLSGSYSRTSPAGSRSSTTSGSIYNQYSGSASLSQSIYDFGKTKTQVEIQQLNTDASRSDLKNVTEQIVFNVKKAYYELLQAKKNKDVANEAVKQFQKHFERAKGFYEAGVKPKFDVTKAEVDLSNARFNLIRADNALRISLVNLNNAMGIVDAPDYEIEDDLLFKKHEITLEAALSEAVKNRPDLQAVILRTKVSEDALALAKKGYYPVITGNASYNYGGDSFPLNNGWSVGAGITFPIFSGFMTKHQVAESVANLNAAKANEELLRQNIVFDVQQSYLYLKEAENKIPVSELTVKQAFENLELANGRYDAGVGSPIEVTDAQIVYINARTSYIQALSDYKISEAALEKAIGVRK